MLELTRRAKDASKKIQLTPTIVFQIEGLDELFTSAGINTAIRIGDPLLEIGGGWKIGGVRLIEGQSTYISFSAGGGTTTKISQKLSPDRAQGSTISSLVMSLLDKNQEISKLISPGFTLEDVLGRNTTVKIGFIETSFPEDYTTVFRGIISDIESGPGYINFLLANSEEKKRRPLIKKGTTELAGNISPSDTTITVIDGSIFQTTVNGPNGSPDANIEYLLKIGDEVIKYTTVSTNTITGVTRGYLGTTAAAHVTGDDAAFGARIQGVGMDLALKIMLSGLNDYFATEVKVAAINFIDQLEPLANSVFFENVNVGETYGITAGDYVTITDAINPGNNVTLAVIGDVDTSNDGSYVILDGVTLITELNSTAKVSFRSKYDSFGIGLKMTPAEVDVTQHEFIRDLFLNTFSLDFQGLFDVPITKDFIEQQIYLPQAAFSVPRKGRSSVTYTIGPIAKTFIPTLNLSNVKNAAQLKLKRSIAANFANTIQYEFDYTQNIDKYSRVKEFDSPLSKARIQDIEKPIKIQSQGMRTSLGAIGLADRASLRMLGRYQFGAEYINGVQLLYGEGYPIEIGDIVLVDYKDLQLTDVSTGNRSGTFKYMEVINKTLDNKTGDVSIDLLNTAFDFTDRYGVISPSSKCTSDSTTTRLVLKKSWGTKFYDAETEKWDDYKNFIVMVHSPDYSVVGEAEIKSIGRDPDTLLIDPPLGFTPLEDYIVDIVNYPTDTDPNTYAEYKAMHAFWSPNVPVVAAVSQIRFEVDPADFPKFLVDAIVRINNFDYSEYSPEAKVIAVYPGTNEIEIDEATGFTINNTHEVKLIGFADGGYSYRII